MCHHICPALLNQSCWFASANNYISMKWFRHTKYLINNQRFSKRLSFTSLGIMTCRLSCVYDRSMYYKKGLKRSTFPLAKEESYDANHKGAGSCRPPLDRSIQHQKYLHQTTPFSYQHHHASHLGYQITYIN